MTIYVVTEGEYSSYHIEAVFLERSEAEKYVATHENDIWYVYSIEEFETRDGKIECNDEIVYLYEFWRGDLGKREPIYLLNIKTKDYIQEKINYHAGRTDEFHYVLMKNRDDDLAVKIAQDEFAKRKAAKEGVC